MYANIYFAFSYLQRKSEIEFLKYLWLPIDAAWKIVSFMWYSEILIIYSTTFILFSILP